MPIMLQAVRRTTLSLLFANMVGGIMALAFGWSVPELMLAYWLENLAIGLINIIKMIIVGTHSTPLDTAGQPITYATHVGLTFFTVPFFVVHYGGFLAGHAVFLAALFQVDFTKTSSVSFIFLPLLAHHIYSLIVNFIGKKEYEGRMVMVQMFSPYARVVLLHIAIIIGGAIALLFNSQWFAAAILIVGKIILDAFLHIVSHTKKFRPSKHVTAVQGNS